MPPSRPRAFISYRHTEYEGVPNADTPNVAHRQWVSKFALDLNNAGVETVHDNDLRQLFARYSDSDPYVAPFVAEISSVACLVCHAFIVILTPSYLDRIGYANYENQRHTRLSYAQEEWHWGMHFANAGVIQYVPIVRVGDPEKMMKLPLGVTPDTTFDMRDPAHYSFQINFIAQRILGAWDGDHPLLKMNVAEWMDFYIRWCNKNYPGCAEKTLDEWQMDLVRPRSVIARILSSARNRTEG